MPGFKDKKDIVPDPTMQFYFACGCITPQLIHQNGKQHIYRCPDHKTRIDYITKACVSCGTTLTLTSRQLITKWCKACAIKQRYKIKRRELKRAYKPKDFMIPHDQPVGYNDPIISPITRSPCINCTVHLAGLSHDNITCHNCPKRMAYSDYLASDPLEQLGLINTKYDSDSRHQVHIKTGSSDTLYSNTIGG